MSYLFSFSYCACVLRASILKWFAIPFSSGERRLCSSGAAKKKYPSDLWATDVSPAAPVGRPVGGGPGSSAPHSNPVWRPLAERPPCWLAVWGPECCGPALVAAWPHGTVSAWGQSCPDVQCSDLYLREPGGLPPDCCLTVSPRGVQSVAFWNLNLCASP